MQGYHQMQDLQQRWEYLVSDFASGDYVRSMM